MGFTTANLSLYHTFSKTPVDSNTNSAAAQLGNAINKSGHTVQSNEIWTESIPFFGLAATTTAIHNKFSATAKVNDLVKDSDGKIWQRNSTAYSTSAEFADLWSEKTKSITSFTKGTDGKYTFTEVDGALVDGSYLLNSDGIPTVKYYEKRLLTRLTADNNANTNSDNKASRLQIDGKWIDQFIGVTDIYLNGSAAVSYAPVLRKTSSSSPMQAGPGKGYMDYCATGLILWEESAAGTEVIDCFEYVGTKLNTALTTISDSVKDIVNTTMQGVVASVGTNDAAQNAGIGVDSTITTSPKITFTAGSVTTGETKLVSGGAVAAVTDALAGRIAALEGVKLSVKVVNAVPTTPVVNTLYLVPEEDKTSGNYVEYIAYKPEGSETVTTERIGTTAVDLEGYTTDAEHTALANRVTVLDAATTGRVAVVEDKVKALEETTVPAVQQSVTDLTKTVGDNKTAIEKALADAKTEIGKTTSGLDARLQTAEGQVATITSTDATKDGSIAKALADAKTYAEGQASAAEAAAKSEASTNLSAAVEQIGKDIEAAKQAAIANAKVTLTADTTEGKTGIVIDPNDTQSTSFTIGVDQSVIATKTSVDELSGLVTGVSQTVAGIQTELSTGSVATGISAAQTAAQTAQEAADAAQATANQAKTTADSAVQSVTRASGSSTLLTVTDGTDVTISLSTEVATKTDAANAASTAITTSLNGTTAGTIGAAVADAKKAGTDASDALNTAKGQSLAQTGTLTGMFSVATEGTVGTGITNITIEDKGLSTAISNARTNAVADVKALILSASDTDDAAKVTVTLGGTVETPSITVSTSDIASAATLSDLVSTVNTHISEAAGLYLSVEKVDTLPADIDAKTNKIYLVPVDTDAGREQNIHTEYIWTNNKWEVIGTTAIDMNSLEAAADAAQAAADAAQAAVDALTQTHATDKAALEGSIDTINNTIAAMDADLSVNGISVKQVNGTVTELSESLITASVPVGTTSVEGNVAYVGSAKHVIAPEKFQTAAQMPTTLTSWVADLSNLTVGDNMFKDCTGLTVFVGDLSSLTSGVDMFNGCTLDADSLEILSENLPTVSGGTIDIGASTNATDEVKATIKGKGWTLKSNGADVA